MFKISRSYRADGSMIAQQGSPKSIYNLSSFLAVLASALLFFSAPLRAEVAVCQLSSWFDTYHGYKYVKVDLETGMFAVGTNAEWRQYEQSEVKIVKIGKTYTLENLKKADNSGFTGIKLIVRFKNDGVADVSYTYLGRGYPVDTQCKVE